MDQKLVKSLLEKYPLFFPNIYGDYTKTSLAFGLECGNGWFSIMEELCEKIASLGDIGFEFTQIKEKWGLLRVYYTFRTEIECCWDKIDELIDAAETKSGHICEHCGSKDDVTHKARGGWISTLCNSCDLTICKNIVELNK